MIIVVEAFNVFSLKVESRVLMLVLNHLKRRIQKK